MAISTNLFFSFPLLHNQEPINRLTRQRSIEKMSTPPLPILPYFDIQALFVSKLYPSKSSSVQQLFLCLWNNMAFEFSFIFMTTFIKWYTNDCLQGYGRMKRYQLTGRRVISLNFQRKAISVNVPTTEELLCCLCLEKFSTGPSWKDWRTLSILSSGINRQESTGRI